MRLIRTAMLLAAVSSTAHAQVLFNDSFNAENGGASALNYTSLANWNVSRQAVDLIRSGDFGITCRSGTCIDMDGSQSAGGELRLKSPLAFVAGERMRLSFWVSGNQRDNGRDAFIMNLRSTAPATFLEYAWSINATTLQSGTNYDIGSGIGTAKNLNGSNPFELWTFEFVAANNGALQVAFETTSNDNVGPILDDVVYERMTSNVVPEPSTYALLATGLGMIGMVSRRRSKHRA